MVIACQYLASISIPLMLKVVIVLFKNFAKSSIELNITTEESELLLRGGSWGFGWAD